MGRFVVLLSGGVDSTVLLASLRRRGDTCLAVSFDYGQSHSRELRAAAAIADHYGVEHEVVTIPRNVLCGSAISGADAVVPARNLVMLSLATAIAERWGGTAVAFGANKDDLNGFPDCRPQFIESMDEAVYRSGIKCKSVIAPLVHLSKTEVIELGKHLDVPLHSTWSCYRGREEPCQECGSCQLREKALA